MNINSIDTINAISTLLSVAYDLIKKPETKIYMIDDAKSNIENAAKLFSNIVYTDIDIDIRHNLLVMFKQTSEAYKELYNEYPTVHQSYDIKKRDRNSYKPIRLNSFFIPESDSDLMKYFFTIILPHDT